MSLPAALNNIIKKFSITENAPFPKSNYFADLAENLKANNKFKVFKNGISRANRPLVAFAIGRGEKVIGVTSGAHSDEPIGVLTQYYLINGLINNPSFEKLLDEFTFLCQPLVDPDGYELNSMWFKNPLNFTEYFLNNYRNNKPSEDCEHGIPFQDGQAARSEMVFVKENLDRYKGKFSYYTTLHSSHILPGACFVFDRDHKDESLRNSISSLCQSYQLPLMDYKLKGDDTMTYLGPGFIGAPNVTQMLDKYKNNPEILRQLKMTTYEYVKTYCGAKTAFISELPMWICEGHDDYRDSNMTVNDFKKHMLENTKAYLKELEDLYTELNQFKPPENNPWYGSLKTALQRGAAEIQDEETKIGSYEGFAQMLEVKELEAQPSEYASRAFKYAIKSVEGIPSAQSFKEQKQEKFDAAISEYQKKMNLKQLSVKTQVEIQLGLIFSGIDCQL